MTECKVCEKRRRGANKDFDMGAHKDKTRRLLHMIIFLMRARRSMADIQERFGFINKRTPYRYLKLIDKMDVGLEQDFEDRYFIVDEQSRIN